MYTVDYFISKFEAIPEEKWAVGTFLVFHDESRCAIGHCLSKNTIMKIYRSGCEKVYIPTKKEKQTTFQEAYRLCKLFNDKARIGSIMIIDINNRDNQEYQQPTPKQRILAALYDIKTNQAVEDAQQIINTESVKHDTPIIRYAF